MSRQFSELRISRTAVTLLGLLICTLVVLNVLLIVQNKNLRAATTLLSQSGLLKAGTVVPSLSGLDVDGREINVDYKNDSREAVLLIFSPRCKFCTKNMPNWREIIQRLDRNSHRLIAVSLVSEGVREYVAQQGLSDVPVIAEMAPISKQSYHMTATPQTVLIDSQGRVEKVWSGVIEPGAWHDLEQSLALRP